MRPLGDEAARRGRSGTGTFVSGKALYEDQLLWIPFSSLQRRGSSHKGLSHQIMSFISSQQPQLVRQTGVIALLMDEEAEAQRNEVTCPRSQPLSSRARLEP